MDDQRSDNFRALCGKCGAHRVDGQIGLEQSPAEYVAQMVEVFREVRRVLRDDGTVWLNLGDSYNNFRVSKGPGQAVHGRDKLNGKPAPDSGGGGWKGLKEKDLMMIPSRVAIALCDDGWYLRSNIIWAKRNCMPESVRDRPTNAHEHIFLLTKRPSYFYDAVAIEEDAEQPERVSADKIGGASHSERQQHSEGGLFTGAGKRNKRSVWWMATQPFPEAHFATFPPELPEICIKAGTSERGCCSACGAAWVRTTERSAMPRDMSRPQAKRAVELYKSNALTLGHIAAIRACGVTDAGKAAITQTGAGKNDAGIQRLADEAKVALGGYHREFLLTSDVTTGWLPSCPCAAGDPVPCTVLDPFAGAFTTALVADRLGRDCIGIELNAEYCDMARRRIERDAGMFAQVAAQ